MARFRVVTKHQVSGWRFLLHRIEHALVRRDASMIDDPQRGRSTALSIGVALACIGIAGSAVLSFFKPDKPVGDAKIVAEKDTGALYVRLGERLHPTLNLTSARLILGSAEKPVEVSGDKLGEFPRGPWVGIPGAPGSIAEDGKRDSSWAVCDTARSGASAPLNPETGLPTLSRSALQTTALGGPMTVDGESARELSGSEARLLRGDDGTWLVYDDPERGLVRAAIDLGDSPVMLALGIDATAPVAAASKGLIDAIPEAPPLRAPEVPDAGKPTTLNPKFDAVIGSVLTVSMPERGDSYYLVSESGLVRISAVVAAMVRNADSFGAVASTTVGPDVVAANVRPGDWPGTATYPNEPVDVLDPATLGVTCYHWERSASDSESRNRLLVGRSLPVPQGEQKRPLELVTAPASEGNTADAAYLPETRGKFVQVTGAEPGSPLRGALYWISDSGVRYGIATGDSEQDQKQTGKALGLGAPIPAPWSVVSLFAAGPTLSPEDAKIAHDGIPPNVAGAGMGGGSS